MGRPVGPSSSGRVDSAGASGTLNSLSATSPPINVDKSILTRSFLLRSCSEVASAHEPNEPTLRAGLTRQQAPAFLSPRPRVRLQIDLTETIHGDEGVDLSGGHRRMPEQFLHHPHVGAAFKKMGGIAVPQRVG